MLEERANELRAGRVPYVHCRVVLAEAPTSAKPGAEAIVLPDGTIEGFVGGSCAESTVRAQGLAMLDTGESMLLRITPGPEPGQSGKLVVHNPCLSGGTLEIFMEPVLPSPSIVVVGSAPVAEALRGLAAHFGWNIAPSCHLSAESLGDVTALVVASHGRDEESALSAALEAGVPYIGLVASRKRGAAVIGSLGVDADASRIHSPAGLDIGAHTPDEIALSIVGEIVSLRPRPSGRSIAEAVSSSPEQATDPVCGMSVLMVDDSLHIDVDDQRFWFCGSGCLRAFTADPAAYRPSAT